MTQMSISAKLRPSTVTGKKGSIYIQIIKNRLTKTITTPYRIYSEEWNEQLSTIRLGQFTPKREAELREIIISLEKDIENLRHRVRKKQQDGGCSLQDAVDFYKNKYSCCLFSDFVKVLNSEMLMPEQSRLAEAYQSASNNLIAFNGGNDIPLDAIDVSLMISYENYMKNKRNKLNTISFYMRNTRAIYNKAIKRGLIDRKNEDPFADVFKGVAKTRKRAVKQEIIDQLKRLDLSKDTKENRSRTLKRERDVENNIEKETGKISRKDVNQLRGSLRFARDMFLLSFYMRGISFIDLCYLKKTNLQNDLITYVRHKTGQSLEIALTPAIKEIIRRYEKYGKESEYLLPILSPTATRKEYINALKRQNKQLKLLSKRLDLGTPLTTYVSRHSWATIALSKGVPTAVISQGLGHDSEKTTQIYLDSFDNSILHKANQMVTDFSQKAS